MQVIGWIVVAAASYLVGGLSTGLWISGKLKGMDVRQFGSHSTGATNVLRVMGRKAGLITFGGDILKGVVITLAGMLLAGSWCACMCGFLAVVGHIWPATAQFKGGKGVATAGGAFLVIAPIPMLIALAIALALMYFTQYVSLGSLVGVFVYFLIAGLGGLAAHQPWRFVFSAGVGILVFFAHRENIRRLLEKRENKLDLAVFSGKKG